MQEIFKKYCPSCEKEMLYKRKNALTYSIKNNCKCNSCSSKETMNNILTDKKRNKEYRKKLSNSLKGRKITWGNEISKALIGKKVPQDRIDKLRISMAGKGNPFYGKKHTAETKKKIRLTKIKYLEEKFGHGLCPMYNPNACDIIDEYGKNNEYNFQHAMNGGEFYVKELGYWVDGYDKDKNVVIEYLEKHHRRSKEIIHDMQRKKEIMEFLNCEFIEIKEWEQT